MAKTSRITAASVMKIADISLPMPVSSVRTAGKRCIVSLSKTTFWTLCNGGNMAFEIIDSTTGKPVNVDVIGHLAKDGGLFEHDIDQFYIGEDNNIILMDDCGNETYVDTKRFVPHFLGKYPDFNYFEMMLTGNIMREHPELQSAVAYNTHSPQINVFPQTWASTAGGFEAPGFVAGAAMTTELTTVIEARFVSKDNKDHAFYGVFFGNKPAYIIEDPPENFFEDIKNRQMKSKHEVNRYIE